MEYTLEKAFCDDVTRQFLFTSENKLINFIQQSEGIYHFYVLNSLT